MVHRKKSLTHFVWGAVTIFVNDVLCDIGIKEYEESTPLRLRKTHGTRTPPARPSRTDNALQYIRFSNFSVFQYGAKPTQPHRESTGAARPSQAERCAFLVKRLCYFGILIWHFSNTPSHPTPKTPAALHCCTAHDTTVPEQSCRAQNLLQNAVVWSQKTQPSSATAAEQQIKNSRKTAPPCTRIKNSKY